jgi:hypothetical protein
MELKILLPMLTFMSPFGIMMKLHNFFNLRGMLIHGQMKNTRLSKPCVTAHSSVAPITPEEQIQDTVRQELLSFDEKYTPKAPNYSH